MAAQSLSPSRNEEAERLWQPARLVRDERSGWWLEFEAAGRCARCVRGVGCGAGLFARLLTPVRMARVPVRNERNFPHGASVHAGIEAAWLVRTAAWIYLAPLLLFVIGTWFADRLLPGHDGLALGTGLLLSAAAFWIARGAVQRVPCPVLTWDRTTDRDNDGLETTRRCSHLSNS